MEILYMQNILRIIVKLSQSKQLLIRVQLQKFCFHIVNTCVHSVNISGGGTGGGGGAGGQWSTHFFCFFIFYVVARHHAERSGM